MNIGIFFLPVSTEIPNIYGMPLPLFTILTSFVSFIIGLYVNQFIDKRKENKRLKQIEKYIMFQLRREIRMLNKDIKNVEKLIMSINEEKFQDYDFIKPFSFYIENIKSISLTDRYKIFVEKKKAPLNKKLALFNSLESSLELTYRNYNNAYLQYSKFHQSMYKGIVAWNEGVEKIRKLCDEALVLHNKSGDIFSQNFVRIFNEMFWKMNYDPYHVTSVYIPRYLKLVNEYINHPNAMRLKDGIIQCSIAFKDIKNTKQLQLKQLDYYKSTYTLYLKNCQRFYYQMNKYKSSWFV